jgi:hypothetical protein
MAEDQKTSSESSGSYSNWRMIGQVFCYLCAATWILTGILYSYAGIVDPVLFDPRITFSVERLSEFLVKLQQGSNLYVLVFIVFAIADFSLLVLGAIVREFLGRDDFRSQLIYLCILVGMFLGILVDVMLLNSWVSLGDFATAVSPGVQAAIWAVFLDRQYLGIWLSVASFILGGISMIILYSMGSIRHKHPFWSLFSLLFGITILLECAAIIYDTRFGGNGLLTGGIFLLLTVVVAPIWAITFARLIR